MASEKTKLENGVANSTPINPLAGAFQALADEKKKAEIEAQRKAEAAKPKPQPLEGQELPMPSSRLEISLVSPQLNKKVQLGSWTPGRELERPEDVVKILGYLGFIPWRPQVKVAQRSTVGGWIVWLSLIVGGLGCGIDFALTTRLASRGVVFPLGAYTVLIFPLWVVPGLWVLSSRISSRWGPRLMVPLALMAWLGIIYKILAVSTF